MAFYEHYNIENTITDTEPEQIVTIETANHALERLTKNKENGKIAVLNFASAKHAGGGWLTGAQAQEEALCRTSNLWLGLDKVPEFYEKGRKSGFDYTDGVLYSKDVTFWLNDAGDEIEPYCVDVITCACPNATANHGMFDNSIYEKRLQRIVRG